MTTLTPVIVEETIGTSGDWPNINAWEAGLPQVLTREVAGETCSLTAADNAHIVLHGTADTTTDHYTGLVVEWSGEQRRITAYDGPSRTATVGALNGGPATFSATPQINDAFTIYPVIRKGLLAAENFSALATIAGQTTDADAFMWLTTQADASWRDTVTPATEQIDWDGAKARIDHSPGTTNQVLLTVNTGNTIVQGLQIRAGSQARVNQVVTFSGNVEIRDCLIVDSTSDFQRRPMIRTSKTFVNCVMFWNSESNFSDTQGMIEASAGSAFVNCSMIRSTNRATSNHAVVERFGNCSFRSCAIYGDWGFFQTNSTGTIEVDKCATSLASFGTISSGTGNITSGSIANDMENLADEFGDGRAKAGGNLEAVADVEAETDYGAGAVDCYGQARSLTTPTIGAFELVSAGAALVRLADESLGLTDAQTRALAMARLGGGVVGLNHAVLGSMRLNRSAAAAVGLSTAGLRTSGLNRVANDNVGVTEGRLALRALLRLAAETIGLGETAVRKLSGGVVKVVAETVALVDGLLLSRTLTRPVAEAMALTSTLLRLRALARILAESEGLPAQAIPARGLVRILDESEDLAELPVAVRVLVRVVDELVGIATAAERVLNFFTGSLVKGAVRIRAAVATLFRGVTINNSE